MVAEIVLSRVWHREDLGCVWAATHRRLSVAHGATDDGGDAVGEAAGDDPRVGLARRFGKA